MCSSGFLSNFKLTGLPFPQWTAALVPGRRVTGFIQIELTDGRNPGVRIFPIIQPSNDYRPTYYFDDDYTAPRCARPAGFFTRSASETGHSSSF
jgi:hypothetical protein